MKSQISIIALSVAVLALSACSRTQASTIQTQPQQQAIPPGYHRMANGMLMKNVDMNMRRN